MRPMLLLATLLLPRLAAATIIVPLPEPELVARSGTIVVGTVIRTHPVASASGMVVTRADVQVTRALRGARVGAVVTVEVPGGALPDGTAVAVSGAPKLRAGDMVFGFLERHGDAGRPLGLAFGLLAVRPVGAHDLRVFRNLDGLQLMPKDGAVASARTYAIDGERLDDFAARIEQHVRAQVLPAAPSVPAARVTP